jgi:mucin-19
MVVNVGGNTAVYGVVTSTNSSYLGNALNSSNGVSAGYCTNCTVAGATPNIISLTITPPSAGSNTWIAADSEPGFAQGRYSFQIVPVITVGDYVNGVNLKVGTYAMNAENLVTVPDYQKRFQESALKPIIYNAGTLSISPKALTIANTVVDNKTYDATNVAVVRGGSLVGLAAGDDPAEFALSQAGTFCFHSRRI